MANLDVGAKQFVSLDIGAVQSPGVSPDFTESLSDTLVLSDSPGEGRGYLFSDALVLADVLGIVSGAFQEQFGDSLFLKDAAAVDFVYSPPGGQRGNIDYDQIRLSARAGTGAKLHTLTGSVTTGHTVVFDASGNLVDSGAAPSGSGPTSQNDVTGSRVIGTVYHNTGTVPMFVSVTAHSSSAAHASLLVQTDASNPPTTYVAYQCLPSTPDAQSVFFIVLPGNYYKATVNVGTPTLDVWIEWS